MQDPESSSPGPAWVQILKEHPSERPDKSWVDQNTSQSQRGPCSHPHLCPGASVMSSGLVSGMAHWGALVTATSLSRPTPRLGPSTGRVTGLSSESWPIQPLSKHSLSTAKLLQARAHSTAGQLLTPRAPYEHSDNKTWEEACYLCLWSSKILSLQSLSTQGLIFYTTSEWGFQGPQECELGLIARYASKSHPHCAVGPTLRAC